MRAAVRARGQGGKRPRTSPLAVEATRPLTARCGRYHEESVAGQGSTGPGMALADHEGNATSGLGLGQPSTHNATPAEDYRTALLSDSPHKGVRYAGGRG